MIIAVVAVRMVQVSVDQIVGVIAMRHRFVTAAWSVPMNRIVSAAAVLRGAPIGIRYAYFDCMLVDVIFMQMMEMTIVKVVHVAVVPNRDMTVSIPTSRAAGENSKSLGLSLGLSVGWSASGSLSPARSHKSDLARVQNERCLLCLTAAGAPAMLPRTIASRIRMPADGVWFVSLWARTIVFERHTPRQSQGPPFTA